MGTDEWYQDSVSLKNLNAENFVKYPLEFLQVTESPSPPLYEGDVLNQSEYAITILTLTFCFILCLC